MTEYRAALQALWHGHFEARIVRLYRLWQAGKSPEHARQDPEVVYHGDAMLALMLATPEASADEADS